MVRFQLPRCTHFGSRALQSVRQPHFCFFTQNIKLCFLKSSHTRARLFREEEKVDQKTPSTLDLHQLHCHTKLLLWLRGREVRAQIWKEPQGLCYRQCTAAQTVCVCEKTVKDFYKHMLIEVHSPGWGLFNKPEIRHKYWIYRSNGGG